MSNDEIGAKTGSFHKVPGVASKVSHLHDWKLLESFNAPAIQYVQKMTQEPCIPKAFVSILHHDGFVDQAKCIDANSIDKIFCFHRNDSNMRAIYEFGKQILPR